MVVVNSCGGNGDVCGGKRSGMGFVEVDMLGLEYVEIN